VIIGSGIAGISTALTAQRAGLACCLIDALPPHSADRASFGNAGILARGAVLPIVTRSAVASLRYYMTSSDSPVSFRYRYLHKWLPWTLRSLRHLSDAEMRRIAAAQDHLLFDTLEQHRALAAGTDAADMITECRLTYLYKSEADARADNQEAWVKKERGIRSEDIHRTELHKNDPALSSDFTFGLGYPGHGWISDPGAYLNALYAGFQDAGGKVQIAEVSRIADDGVLLQSGQIVPAGQIVVSAGAKSAALLRPLGIRVPMIAERGYHLHIPNCPIMPPAPYLVEGKFGLTPMRSGLRVAGTTEMSSITAPIQESRFEYLKTAVRAVYPEIDLSNVTTWVGHRPSLPDSLPCIGRLKTHPQIVCAFGGQHLGLTMGPKLGQIATDILREQPINADLAPYAPERFSRL